MRGHQPHDPFGGYPDAHALQLQVDPLVSIAPLAVLERLAHELQQRRVLVGTFHGVDLVMVRAARDADHGQQAPGGNAHRLANGLDEERLLSAGRAFSGSAPGSFPNSSNAPFRIAIWMSSSRSVRRRASILASSPSRRACISASLLSIDASASARPATSLGPPAADGVSGTAGRAPALLFLVLPLRSFVTCVSLDPASIRRFQFPDDGRLHAQFGGRLM